MSFTKLTDLFFTYLPNIIFLCLGIIVFILTFRIIRFIYFFLRYYYLNLKYGSDSNPKQKEAKPQKPKPSHPDEFKARDKEKETELAESKQEFNTPTLHEDREIVGIAKPIGKWTEFVTHQKISWLRAMVGSKTQSDQFWQNIVKAQERAQGKQQSRQR